MRPLPVALAIFALFMSLSLNAWAGRPLGTDDASTADARICQLESWIEGAGGEHALVLAPACGVATGMEIDADYTLPERKDVRRAAGGLAFKWVPQAWRITTALGELNFGIKVSASFEHPTNAGWRSTETALLALATLKASDAWATHADLGAAREPLTGTTATLLKLSLVWTPSEPALLFAETEANNRHAVFGGTVNTAGGRWWLIKDRVGLDISASREAGSGNPAQWTLGFGWYGLSF